MEGRILGASGDRILFREYKNYHASNAYGDPVESTINDIKDNTAELVEKIVTPLFEKFDFLKVENEVIEDIVRNFKEGRIT